jgi:hypothetical protein
LGPGFHTGGFTVAFGHGHPLVIIEGKGLPKTAYNKKPPYSLKGVSLNFFVNRFIYNLPHMFMEV